MSFDARRIDGFWGWRASEGDARVYFGGRGPRLDRETMLRRVVPEGVEPAWAKQVHSAAVLDARPGVNGEGDALMTRRRALALAVVTADCVPLLLSGEGQIAAVHAGWRGLAQSILEAALESFEADASRITAWIGPAIGPCCYEVGPEVCEQVVAASSPEVARDGPRGRPHLDLAAAARLQLERRGISDVRTLPACTRCDETRLWSYRREGPGAGRNVAAIWRV